MPTLCSRFMSMLFVLGATAATVWLLGVAACVLALAWSFASPRRYSRGAVALALLGAVIAYLGLTRISLNWSETVNGQVRWHIDTKWFFSGLLVAALATLAFALWQTLKYNPPRRLAPPPPVSPGSAPATNEPPARRDG